MVRTHRQSPRAAEVGDTPLRRVVLLLVLALMLFLGALLVWGLMAFAYGRSGEDVCLDDSSRMPLEYGSRLDAELWPPRYDCVLSSGDDVVVVSHPVRAVVRFAIVAVYPVIAVVVGVVAFELVRRRTRRFAVKE